MNRLRGFTLLELAIVLVIIGFITAGVAVGRSFIRSAEVQSVITDVTNYRNAIKLFKDKYHEMPGDMPNATSFWNTTNGTGDGFIGASSSTPVNMNGDEEESPLAWQHLSLGGFITGSYDGSNASWQPGVNIPLSKLAGNGFTLSYAAPGSDTTYYLARYRHIFVVGKPLPSTSMPVVSAGILGVDALRIDQKMDDGKPGQGSVLSFTPNLAATSGCASSATAASATYLVTSTTPTCSLIFITGF